MHVLNVTEVHGVWWSWVMFGFFCALFIASAVVSIIDCTELHLGAILIIIAVMIFAVNLTYFKRNQYQVIIDKETTFYEVYEKYNVIKQDGFIFTLEERSYLEDDGNE